MNTTTSDILTDADKARLLRNAQDRKRYNSSPEVRERKKQYEINRLARRYDAIIAEHGTLTV